MKYQNATQQAQVVSFCFAWLMAMFYAPPHAQAQTQNWCVPPDPDYCVSRVCGAGEGDCDPGQCATSLVCVNDVGARYGLPAHYDVCETRSAGTPDPDYCVHNTCGIGDGDCDPGQCDEGVCVNDVGMQYGLPAHYDVCEAEVTPPEPLAQSKVYWSVEGIGPVKAKIQRANLDGSQVETLFEPGRYGDLVVDPNRGHIYWLRGWEIERMNLDGSHRKTILTRPELHYRYNLALDLTRGKLYWAFSEYSNETRSRREGIQRANLDGSQVETVPGTTGAYDLTVDSASGKLYWVLPQAKKEEFRRANLDGSQREVLFAVVTGSGGGLRSMAVDSTRGKLYWAAHGELRQANFDGSHQEVIFSGPEAPKFLGSGPYDIAADPTMGTLYWVTSTQHATEIHRTNFDGSPIEILFEDDGYEIEGLTLALK